MKLQLEDDWKRYTHEEMEDIATYAAEDEYFHGADYRDWMYSYFLHHANGDPRVAFRDMMSFAAQFFNKPWKKQGRPKKSNDELEEQLNTVRKFVDSLEPKEDRSWGQFEKWCGPKGPPDGIRKTNFYGLLKKI